MGFSLCRLACSSFLFIAEYVLRLLYIIASISSIIFIFLYSNTYFHQKLHKTVRSSISLIGFYTCQAQIPYLIIVSKHICLPHMDRLLQSSLSHVSVVPDKLFSVLCYFMKKRPFYNRLFQFMNKQPASQLRFKPG